MYYPLPARARWFLWRHREHTAWFIWGNNKVDIIRCDCGEEYKL